jgi:hypothetical protein
VTFTFEGKIWRWTTTAAPAAWHFVTLPEDVSGQIRFFMGKRQGFGSVRVSAQIGVTSWKTSLFPDSKSGGYLLPVKAEVRRKENVGDGDLCSVTVSLSDIP